MERVRWGIIGCGDVCEKKSGPAFHVCEGSELRAVMRRDADKARDFAHRHGVARWYADADALIGDPDVDAVYIATPPSAHADYVMRVAAAGKPAYVEKPMAVTHAQCVSMLDACERAGVKLFVAYYRRMLPVFVKVKALLDANAAGTVRMVRADLWHPPRAGDMDPREQHWHVRPAISGGGYLFDLGSHLLDILDFFFGPAVAVKAHVVNQAGWYDAEDAACASLKFASGVIGSLSFCFTADAAARTDRIEIVGSEGSISFSCFANNPVVLNRPEGREEFAAPLPEHVQQPLIQTIVDELRGRGCCPSTGVSGARTSLVLDQMVHAA
jgi:predicted dehydrogenase